MTGEEILKLLAEKYPYYQYTKRQIWDFLRRGSKGEDPIFMIVNQYRAKGDPNRWAIRPEIEPQLRRWLCDHPPPQPLFLQSSSDHSQLVPAVREAASAALCEPQTGSKRTDSWKSPCATTVSVPSCPTLGVEQPFPQPALQSTVGEDPLADQSPGKLQRISHQEVSTPTQQPFSASTKDPLLMTWNNWHKRELKERMIRPIASMQRSTAIIGDHLDAAIREDAALQRLRDCSNGISTFDSRRNHMLYTKAAVLSTRGVVELGVKIDGSSEHNLLPWSIANRLRLTLHFGKSIQIGVADHIIPTNQYCRFNIQVASVETNIDAYVVSELPSLLLGREWIRQINLLSDFGNHKYYISGLYGNLTQVLDLRTAVATETETCESATAGEIAAREQTAAVDKVPTTKDRSNAEYPLGKPE
jgi:hypothetical protein